MENKLRPLETMFFDVSMTTWTILVEGHQSNIPAKLHWTRSNGFLREDF